MHIILLCVMIFYVSVHNSKKETEDKICYTTEKMKILEKPTNSSGVNF